MLDESHLRAHEMLALGMGMGTVAAFPPLRTAHAGAAAVVVAEGATAGRTAVFRWASGVEASSFLMAHREELGGEDAGELFRWLKGVFIRRMRASFLVFRYPWQARLKGQLMQDAQNNLVW
jgi:hypothetical protein